MFSTVLLAWEVEHPSTRALAIAAEFARVYDADLTVAVLVPEHEPEPGRLPELDAAYAGAAQVTVSCRHAASDLVAFAHEHGFDVIVVGHHPPEHVRRIFTHDRAREIVDRADVPVLVVAEDDFVSPAGEGAAAPRSV
jgi:nucleotide-binding universal stress UspA family protein